ncbi:glucosamine-6-phosphate deaminase [Pseudarthrobacter sp. S9]|uniref:glucosamine-6-phosphate deaminase n=1 Tax=Pseudarthrobacter sp. S9 TaxID=3418421 RepID=UPI003CFFB44C
MKIIKAGTSAQAGIRAARIVAALIREKPDAVLGLATGSSPLPLYEALGGENLDLSAVRGFSLDEYLGLGSTHKHSYAQVIRREVIDRLGLTPALIHTPDGEAEDAAREASDFEARIHAAGGIDIQILGIGSNGHLAFNEPPSAFTSRTRAVELADSTRTDNARFFDSLEDVPTHAITQGLGTISEARHLLLIAHGQRKAEAAARAIEGPVTEQFPASMIQLHPNVTVILDEAAASRLQRT